MTYTFNLVAGADGDNETETENVTAIRVNMADIVVKKYSVGKIIFGKLSILLDLTSINAGAADETVMKTCGRLCSVKSCKCFTKMIWSDSCYIDFYVGHNFLTFLSLDLSSSSLQEYGLQVDAIDDT